MESFYGGKNGKSFEIRKIFTTKYKTPDNLKPAVAPKRGYDSMEEDLIKGWTSNISIGEFVVISYGYQDDDGYEIYKQTDILSQDKRNYNSSLWQKIYTEEQQNGQTIRGVAYAFISQMTGSTPWFLLGDANDPTKPMPLPTASLTKVLDADQPPVFWIDNAKEHIDNPIMYFALPQAQVIKIAEVEELLPVGDNDNISVRLDKGNNTGDTGTVNNPIIKFKLPRAQVFDASNIRLELENANVSPTLVVTYADPTTKEKPILTFHLPKARILTHDPSVINADDDPIVQLDQTDVNNPKVITKLPRQWDFENTVGVTSIAPDASASATLTNSTTDEHNIKKLALSIPRGVKFYYGDKLGNKADTILSDPSFANYGVGDYYINEATGFIYQVSSITGTTVNFKYIACIQAPLPGIDKTPISPYIQNSSGGWIQNDPDVTRTVSADGTTWELDFSLPKAPTADLTCDYVGSLEKGSASVSIKDANTLLFDFDIPAGAKIFSGLTQPATGAKPGDIFLNSNTGKVYQLDLDKVTWNEKDGTLKGDVGNALNIVASYELTVATGYDDNLTNTVNYITANYTETISSEDIFAITWKYTDGSSVAYWCFKLPDGTWSRVQLTGGIGNIIENNYNNTSPDNQNKVYTAAYINSLIGSPAANNDTDKRTTFSKEQIIDMLTWGHWDSSGTLS